MNQKLPVSAFDGMQSGRKFFGLRVPRSRLNVRWLQKPFERKAVARPKIVVVSGAQSVEASPVFSNSSSPSTDKKVTKAVFGVRISMEEYKRLEEWLMSDPAGASLPNAVNHNQEYAYIIDGRASERDLGKVVREDVYAKFSAHCQREEIAKGEQGDIVIPPLNIRKKSGTNTPSSLSNKSSPIEGRIQGGLSRSTSSGSIGGTGSLFRSASSGSISSPSPTDTSKTLPDVPYIVSKKNANVAILQTVNGEPRPLNRMPSRQKPRPIARLSSVDEIPAPPKKQPWDNKENFKAMQEEALQAFRNARWEKSPQEKTTWAQRVEANTGAPKKASHKFSMSRIRNWVGRTQESKHQSPDVSM